MDIFTEYIVKRKKTSADYVKVVCSVILIAMTLCIMPIVASIQYIGIILFLVCAGIIYVLYNLIVGINLEYEYIFTNGALDVDKIIAARRRKRITSLNARTIEVMASVDSNELNRYINDRSIKKKYACSSVNDDGVYFVIYSDDKNKYMLLFNPNDEIKDGFRRLNPQKVFITD